MRLSVVPAAALAATIARERPDAVVTIASPGRALLDLQCVPHLSVIFHDIVAPEPGLLPPNRHAIERLLAFGRMPWRCLVVSCEFGVSRSPAAAFALICQARPDLAPAEIAHRLRTRAPQATPNALVVALADTLLGRGGAMRDAIAAIGRGRDYAGPEPFALDLAAIDEAAA